MFLFTEYSLSKVSFSTFPAIAYIYSSFQKKVSSSPRRHYSETVRLPIYYSITNIENYVERETPNERAGHPPPQKHSQKLLLSHPRNLNK